MWKFALVATVALGDFCLDQPGGVRIRVALQGNQINVNVSASDQWVGVGVPQNPQFDEMAKGNFVAGSGTSIHDRMLSLGYNTRPDLHVTSVVNGSGSVTTVGGVTSLSYSRLLAPTGAGLIAIDATKPFRLLWAHGKLKPGLPSTSMDNFQYHEANRGSFMVDLVKGNCAAVPAPVSAPAPAPATGKAPANATAAPVNATAAPANATAAPANATAPSGKGKLGKGKAKGKNGPVCATNQTPCTKKLQAKGNNCVLGKCVKKAGAN